MRKVTWLLPLVTAIVAAAVAGLLPSSATSAAPASGTVSPVQTTAAWQGGPATASNPSGACLGGGLDVICDRYLLTITPPATGDYSVNITVTIPNADDDWDLFVYGPDGNQVGSSTNGAGSVESVPLNNPVAGTYEVFANPWLVNPGGTYSGKATMTVGKTYPPSSTGSVLWDFDASAPQATVEVPLRVVMVGFAPGSVDASKVIGEIPNTQRPGVLIPWGQNPSGDSADFPLGADTLVNHGRSYFDNSKPFLVPYEYKWKPQVVYAPDTFAQALFAQMRAQSSTGDFSDNRMRAYLEKYNSERGVYRGSSNSVTPNAPVRFVNAEPIEDWIAANSKTYLGFASGPKGGKGKGPGANPGYTIYFLNTWDSNAAKTALQPQHEYHVFKIDRKDPDTGLFAGIDWARVWGGHYRFMMMDLGAAPNPYESLTWGNRRRDVVGSAGYDPPLWEYRANAPRPVTPVHLADGWTQAVTPGATWDQAQLNYMLGREVNEAASFRFEHSYLYEPRPETGQYWISDNVWHDKFAEPPWASDLTKLYNLDVVLHGLSTLVPYFTFKGDAKFEYLAQGGANYDADQAMLQQAKQDGDDIAGAPGVAMHTNTAMDYLDANADRFERGGPCFTTIPGINVVAEKHYAWGLAIAAGIATNRDGKPWGYLDSVNDVFKYPGADRDPMLQATHPDAFSGSFTYTAVHEASHRLGLAHPHDTVGATRRADGTPRYYDGFSWTYDSSAVPTTYAFDELTYSILDQENIARGHSAYYLKWADEALQEGGRAYYDKGTTTLNLLPADAASFRSQAINLSNKAAKLFASFDFVNAAYAAQAAWRAAANYRDIALSLAPGTSELQRGTAKAGADSCPSATTR
jgi:hypothetical protein